MTTITTTPSTVIVNGQSVTGRRWLVDVTNPTETSTEAITYITRNTGKTRLIHAFLGIPYSRQPVGEFRFKPALKVAPTSAIDATAYGSVSPQGYSQETVDTGLGRTDLGVTRGLSAWAALGTREGEDCLNLNIWTPNPSASLPVIVQFHGGGSNYLSSVDDRLAGHRLCTKGAVVVRVEYRVGNLGHYYLPDMASLTGFEGTVNFSLTDAKAALEWVRDHISSFGGNPANVTIHGGSAGGNMVLCMLANTTFSGLFNKAWVSSASAGFDTRVSSYPIMGMPSYQDYFAYRQTLIEALAPNLPDALDTTRKLSDAIADVGFSEAMRKHIRLQDLLAIDEGRTGVSISGANGYTATRSLTIMNDGKSVFYTSNREAALAGAYAAKPLVIGVCEDEASVVGGTSGNAPFYLAQLRNLCNVTAHKFVTSPVFNTEYNGNTASPVWATVDMTLPRLPWGAQTEPNRMIFNHGYAHAAYRVAQAVSGTYLYHFNYRAQNKASTGRTGHTADEPYLFANPLWDLDPPSTVEPITTRDIQMAEVMSQFFVNFANSGNPNTPYNYVDDFALFNPGSVYTLTAFDPSRKNWNVFGNPFRSALASPLTVTNYNNFWSHAWDFYDSRIT